jgi:hypothetical protein
VESNHWHCTQAVPWLAMSQPFGLGLSPSLSRPKPGPAVLGHDEHCPKTRDSPSVLIPFYHRNDTNQRKSSKSAKVRVGDIPHPRSPETPWGSGKKRPASPYPLALPSLSPHCHACPSCPVPTTSYGHNDQHPRTPPNAGERMIATHPARGADRPPPSGILRATPTTRPSPGHYDQSGRAKNEKTARIRGTSPRIICINMGNSIDWACEARRRCEGRTIRYLSRSSLPVHSPRWPFSHAGRDRGCTGILANRRA